MKAKIYCKTIAKGRQAFYVELDGKDYFLFEQDYRVSNKNFFRKGVMMDALNDYSKTTSHSVKRTLDKLPSYIRYIEKEFDLAIYDKTKLKQQGKKASKAYKRTPFLWSQAYGV